MAVDPITANTLKMLELSAQVSIYICFMHFYIAVSTKEVFILKLCIDTSLLLMEIVRLVEC